MPDRLTFHRSEILQRTIAEIISPPYIGAMFQIFQQYPYQPPQHGNGIWPPLAYALDILGVVSVGMLMLVLLFVAFVYMPLVVH